MTEKHINLIRHAVGLDGQFHVTKRNRYCTCEGGEGYAEWNDLVESGLATVRRNVKRCGEMDIFYATREAASMVLRRGERVTDDFDMLSAERNKIPIMTESTEDIISALETLGMSTHGERVRYLSLRLSEALGQAQTRCRNSEEAEKLAAEIRSIAQLTSAISAAVDTHLTATKQSC